MLTSLRNYKETGTSGNCVSSDTSQKTNIMITPPDRMCFGPGCQFTGISGQHDDLVGNFPAGKLIIRIYTDRSQYFIVQTS